LGIVKPYSSKSSDSFKARITSLNKIDFKIRAWCRKEKEVVKILELVAIDLD